MLARFRNSLRNVIGFSTVRSSFFRRRYQKSLTRGLFPVIGAAGDGALYSKNSSSGGVRLTPYATANDSYIGFSVESQEGLSAVNQQTFEDFPMRQALHCGIWRLVMPLPRVRAAAWPELSAFALPGTSIDSAAVCAGEP
jgi:hypothetical protein